MLFTRKGIKEKGTEWGGKRMGLEQMLAFKFHHKLYSDLHIWIPENFTAFQIILIVFLHPHFDNHSSRANIIFY